MNPYLFVILMAPAFFVCQSSEPPKDGRALIQESINHHDPQEKWNTLDFQLHIQEPRTQNPQRYSIVKLNNATGAFELTRGRGEHVSTHSIDAAGNSQTLLDGIQATDSIVIAENRLQPSRNFGYRNFYQVLLGLPMSLTEEWLAETGLVKTTTFNQQAALQVPVTLKQEMFSKHWLLYLHPENFSYLGMEIVFPDEPDKGERLVFSDVVNLEGVNISRFRHWYDLATEEYLGSDIIVQSEAL